MGSFAAQIPLNEQIWLAVRTKFRSEKMVVNSLKEKGVEAYVPLRENIRRYGARIRKSMVPIINTYIFVHISRNEYITVLDTQHVLYFVNIGNQLVRVTQEEIDLLRKLSGEKVEAFELLPEELEPGDEVKIISGHLTGMTGKLVKWQNKNKLLIELQSIGYQMLVEIPVDSVYR